MTIGTLARAAGVSVETVRYYERRELLEQPERGDGYRRYSEADVERLKFVRRAKELGFTLAEIKDLLVSAECRSASGILAAARVKLGEVEERIVAFSKPGARKVDNLRDEPRVMLAVGTPGPDFEVELIEATAELPDRPATELIPEGFAAKYRELLRRAGLTAQRFAEVYSQPIVLKPTRFLGYGGRGWGEAGALAS